MDFPIITYQMQGGPESFNVTILEAKLPARIALFSVGGGGNPLRHLSLLHSLVSHGCTVIAPHLTRLASPVPTTQELDTRIRWLELALAGYAPLDQPIIGIGHSVGTVVLLALAGAEARTLSGHQVVAGSNWKFEGLALLAPPADFFRHPNALQAVDVRMYIRAGARITLHPLLRQ